MVVSSTLRHQGTADPSGYLHRDYAYSLEEFGQPQRLPYSGGWILRRKIPGALEYDARACYPIFCCQDWGGLERDLAEINDLVSIALVTDPFGKYDPSLLLRCFPDVMVPYKSHFLTDLEKPLTEFVSKGHQQFARRSLRSVSVEHCANPAVHLDDWVELYSYLIRRHTIRGISAFSRQSFARQLQVPGLEMFRAVANGQTIGALLWMVDNQVAYSHLSAYSEAGYKMRASSALFWSACEHFRSRGVRWLDLGGGPGLHDCEDGGLVRFKRSWSTGIRPTYFCGRILNREVYAALARERSRDGEFFPAYRLGEVE